MAVLDGKVAVITGAGRAFCSGADLSGRGASEGVGGQAAHRSLTRSYNPLMMKLAEIDVPTVLGPEAGAHLAAVAENVQAALRTGDAVLRTSRDLVIGDDAAGSLDLSRRVSFAVADVVRQVGSACPPRYVVAKGGITSSDVATESLRADRAWVRGSLLPGIVSLWAPASGPPLVVFAGNVGGEDALADVVDRLEEAACA